MNASLPALRGPRLQHPVQPLARRPRQRLLCALLAACLGLPAAPLAVAQVRLPALGESASDEFTLSQEKRLGEQIMRQIRPDPDYLDDAPLLEYLQALWRPLVQAARVRGDIDADTALLFPYEAFLVRDRSVNAFALPGGYVGVHLGLIALTATADELASVLAHELSHVTQRHIARSISAQSRNSTLGLAAMLLGLLVASRASSPDAAQAAIVGGQAAMAQTQLNFSRDMEREADRNGFSLLGQAGFAQAGMAGMFDKLEQNSRLNDSGGFPYLRSHPLTVDRIGEARQRVEALGGSMVQSAPGALHQLMQARARVLMDPSVQALRRQQGLDERGARADLPVAERLAAYTGAALASSLLRDFARAERAAVAARALADATPPAALDAPARRAVQHTLVQVALARGDLTTARDALAPLAGDAGRPSVLLRANLALAEGQPAALRSGAEALQTWVAERRDDATAWQLLGQLAERLDQPLRAVRAQAEAQAALGNLPGAIDRLRAGQQLARRGGVGTDFIEASVIDARLRDLQAQRRVLLAEQQDGRGRGPREEPQE